MKQIYDETNLWPSEIGAGQVTYPPGGTLGPRLQPNLQLVIIHSGAMSVWIDNKLYQAGANTVFLLLPGHSERFDFAKHAETTHSWLEAFILPPLPDLLRLRLMQLPRPIPLSPIFQDLLSQALRLKHTSLSTREPVLKSIGVCMLWQYIGEAEALQARGAGKSGSRTVERARQFIHNHLSEPITLDILAEAIAISKSQLNRLFKAELKITPIAYLWQQRTSAGVDLLKNTGVPVGVIADRCGFQSRYHFSRSIRQETGRSPKELRQNWWHRKHLPD